jgi:hypothetical protein
VSRARKATAPIRAGVQQFRPIRSVVRVLLRQLVAVEVFAVPESSRTPSFGAAEWLLVGFVMAAKARDLAIRT